MKRMLILVVLAVSGLFVGVSAVTAKQRPASSHHGRHVRRRRRRCRHTGHHHRCRRNKPKRPVHRHPGKPVKPVGAPASAPNPPAVVSSSGTGKIQHVVWILMENEDYSSIIGSSSAPYINSLANTYGLATNYSAISHPSLPNYIALTSGSDQGISDDNDPSSHPLNVPNIFSQLPGGASRSLEENMPSACSTANSGEYAVRHDPETYYTNLGTDCSKYDVPFGSAPDLSARFTFVTPNLIDDMHDGTIADGDNFLKSYVPSLMATPQYQSGSTAVFIVWDENSGSSGNGVPCIVISPYTHGVKDATPFSHYSLLRTTEELLGLPLLANAASANSMSGKFGF